MKKRLILAVMALSSMTMTFANGENSETVSESNSYIVAKNSSVAGNSNYNISYDIRRLGETLGLTMYQMETIDALNRNFNNDMSMAAHANAGNRSKMVNSAVNKDLRYMSYVLTKSQYNKYKLLLNTTISNRGLGK